MSQISLLIWLGLVTMIWSGSVGASAYNVFFNTLICISPYTTSPMIGMKNKVATCKDLFYPTLFSSRRGVIWGGWGPFSPKEKEKRKKERKIENKIKIRKKERKKEGS